MKKIIYSIMTTALLLGASPLSAMEQQNNKDEKNQHIMLTPDEFKWGKGPNALPSGIEMVVLEGDPTKEGPFTFRVKAPANYKIPAHWHPAIEHVTVLKGTIYMGEGDKLDESKGKKLKEGSFVAIPKESHHFAWTGDEEAIIQLHGIGPWGITYINPNDDPRNNNNADKNRKL